LENVLEGLLALCPSDQVNETDLPLKVREKRSLSELPIDAERVHASGLAFGEAEKIFETEMILRALEKANYVQTRAAQLLGITRRILKYKMDKLRIKRARTSTKLWDALCTPVLLGVVPYFLKRSSRAERAADF
jgi:DNA-binding NtrC family response regulator